MEEDFEFEDKQELENVIDNEKHWKSLGIASAVISIICIIIIMAILILTPSKNSGQKLEPYTLVEVLSKKIMKAHRFNGTWISAHEFIYSSDDKNIMLYDCQNEKIRPITTKLNTTNGGEIIHFDISTTRQFLLIVIKKLNSLKQENLECDPSMEYYVYRLDNENMINVQEEFILKLKLLKQQQQKETKRLSSSSNFHQQMHNIPSSSSCIIQSLQWNPMGNILLIMHNNDIYWLDIEQQKLKQITNDGSINDSIYNGFNDNIYRDFIFEKPTSLWWSPVSSSLNNQMYYYLCYLQINNSEITLSNIVIYDDDNNNNGYYQTKYYRYSTLNSSIGTANLWIKRIDIQTNDYQINNDTIKVQPPEKLDQLSSYYIVHVDWLSNKELIVLWSLRDQRRTILGYCLEQNNWKCVELVTLRNWLRMNHVPNSIMSTITKYQQSNNNDDKNTSLVINEINNELFFCGQTPENGVKTFHQLYSFNIKTKAINSYLNVAERYNTEQRQHYQIIELLGFNDYSKSVFFVGQSLNQSTNEDGEKIIKEQDMRINLFVFNLEYGLVHCITCQLVKCYQAKNSNNQSVCIDLKNTATINENDDDEESCIFQRVYFSPSSEYAIVSCLVGIIPKIYLVKFGDLNQSDLVEKILLFDDNSELESRVQSKMMPNVENFIFTRENDNLIKYLRIKILTPQNFNHDEIGKYSMLLEMYPSRYRYHYLPKTTINNQGTFHKRIYPDLEWAVHMVTEHDFIYAWLDGQFYQDSNHSLHELSFEELLIDYSTLIDFIITNMTFVNIAQTCLIGNNVGGYFVLNSLSTTSIECGIAISPFADWNTINSFLAEQYIDVDKVKSNDLQYLLKMTLDWKKLENKNLLIIHGTSNEMFPVRQSMRLMKSLTIEEQNRYIKYHQNPSNNEMDEMNWTSHHFMELYVDYGNSFDTIIEHFYRKIEFFLFQWIII